MCTAGDTYKASTTGPFQCFKADLTKSEGSSALLAATASASYKSKNVMGYRCCGMTEYYAHCGVDVAGTGARGAALPMTLAKIQEDCEDPANILWISSINRATSNITEFKDVYVNLSKAKLTYEINGSGVVKRCYNTAGSSSDLEFPPGPGENLDEDVRFTHRATDADNDAVFCVNEAFDLVLDVKSPIKLGLGRPGVCGGSWLLGVSCSLGVTRWDYHNSIFSHIFYI